MRENRKAIAIYSRKSRFTGKGESVGNQIELCREHIRNTFGEEDALRCVVFEDEGFSGGNLNRPGFQKMMEQVHRQQLKAIVVYRLDRISRNISDFANLIDELTKQEIAFLSIREQFDTGTPMGRAMMYIISVFSQLERETIAQRIRDNMQELAKTGRWLGGNTPTGYDSESVSSISVDGKQRKVCKLKLIPEEAEIVKTIFDLYTETDSLTATEAELMHRHLKSKTGRDYSRFAIKGILQNPVYMVADEDACKYFTERRVYLHSDPSAFDGTHGLMVYNRTNQEKGKTIAYLPMTEWIVAVGAHCGLIPARQWIAVQQSLQRNKSKAYRKPRSNEALLTGVLLCACGARMYPKLSGRTTADGAASYTYICRMKEKSRKERCNRPNVNGNLLDDAVIGQIARLPWDRSRFLAQLKKDQRLITDSRDFWSVQMSDLRAEHAENERKVETLVDALSSLRESEARGHIVRRVEQLQDINRSLTLRIQELEKKAEANVLSRRELEMLPGMLAAFSSSVAQMTLTEKRSAIRALVQRVVWDGEKAHVLMVGGVWEKSAPPGGDTPDAAADVIAFGSVMPRGEDSK